MVKLFKTIAIVTAVLGAGDVFALPPVGGKVFGINPITNEISFYGNIDDSGDDRGRTVQIIAINTLRIGIEFNLEFTADFNWKMSSEKRDHYIELSLVKPFWDRFSVNYQRIISTFEREPVNQFGIRFSF